MALGTFFVLYLSTGIAAASGAPDIGNPSAGGNGTVLSGFLEGSNVDITEAMVDQISNSAIFKANAKVIKDNDEVLGSLIDIKK